MRPESRDDAEVVGPGPLRLLGGSGFALFVLFTLLFSTLFTGALILVPAADTGLGAFARDFRTLCLAADPASGRAPLGAALAMLSAPVLMAAFVALAWARPLAALRHRGPRPLALPAVLALATTWTAAAGLVLTNPPPAGVDLAEAPFPAASLRTSFQAPSFRLVNQLGESLDSADLQGRVVVLTSVYAHCPSACPMILAQAKQAAAALTPEEREGVRFVAVTMDPVRDTPEVLHELAGAQGLDPPTWQLLSGPPEHVNSLLDRMGLAREVDPATGLIEHSNLFLVLDRRGTVAYTFALGELQERWLIEALRLLVAERPPAA